MQNCISWEVIWGLNEQQKALNYKTKVPLDSFSSRHKQQRSICDVNKVCQWDLCPVRVGCPLCHWFLVSFIWTEFLGATRWEAGLQFGDLKSSHLCCLQMMWSFWPHHAWTCSSHESVPQPTVKLLGWWSAPPNLRPRFSAGKRVKCLLRLRKYCPSGGVWVFLGLADTKATHCGD